MHAKPRHTYERERERERERVCLKCCIGLRIFGACINYKQSIRERNGLREGESEATRMCVVDKKC